MKVELGDLCIPEVLRIWIISKLHNSTVAHKKQLPKAEQKCSHLFLLDLLLRQAKQQEAVPSAGVHVKDSKYIVMQSLRQNNAVISSIKGNVVNKSHIKQIQTNIKSQPKRVCCPRPRGNIQREAEKRCRCGHFGHWGSWWFVMLVIESICSYLVPLQFASWSGPRESEHVSSWPHCTVGTAQRWATWAAKTCFKFVCSRLPAGRLLTLNSGFRLYWTSLEINKNRRNLPCYPSSGFQCFHELPLDIFHYLPKSFNYLKSIRVTSLICLQFSHQLCQLRR